MIPFPNKKYQIIYADPPWRYVVWSEKGGGRGKASSHYSTMRFIDILNLPISKIADKNCCLFLWATFPCLPEALEILKQWGFYYKTVAFVWIKKNIKSDSYFWGMGHWTRANTEICLLGTRGKPKVKSHSVHSIVDTKIRKHSQKPDIVRDRIVELMGELPRIELFARKPEGQLFEDSSFEGWDLWGDEVHKEKINV